jgi:PAB1-binding protein PBP1
VQKSFEEMEVGNKFLTLKIDSKLKRERVNFKDDFETFKKKLKDKKYTFNYQGEQISSIDIKKEDIFNRFLDDALKDKNSEIMSQWDQFLLNQDKFNVNTSYEENLYTTSFDLETIPEEVKQKAELIEKVLEKIIILSNF